MRTLLPLIFAMVLGLGAMPLVAAKEPVTTAAGGSLLGTSHACIQLHSAWLGQGFAR
jgi:hypothetical protein